MHNIHWYSSKFRIDIDFNYSLASIDFDMHCFLYCGCDRYVCVSFITNSVYFNITTIIYVWNYCLFDLGFAYYIDIKYRQLSLQLRLFMLHSAYVYGLSSPNRHARNLIALEYIFLFNRCTVANLTLMIAWKLQMVDDVFVAAVDVLFDSWKYNNNCESYLW